MITSEVQRTLVKSPPELWSELSDPEALARHLAEFGEIRITHAEPEQIVEWEAELIRGCVEIKPSGWGTKVTLTATRKPAEPPRTEQASPIEVAEPAEDVPSTSDEQAIPGAAEQAELAALDEPRTERHESVENEPAGDPQPPQTPEPPIEESAVAESVSQEPRRRVGFFARLFRRRRPGPALEAQPQPPTELPEAESSSPSEETTAQQEPIEASQPDVPQTVSESDSACDSTAESVPTPEATSTAESVPEDDPEPKDLSAELAGVEEQTSAVLTSMLDRLGAAHHRPFSRG